MFRASLWIALLILTAHGSAEAPYVSPERVRLAIGPVESLSPALKRAFTVNDDFEALPRPGVNDWLAVHRESGQTFRQFLDSGANVPEPPRDTLYLQPLGDAVGRNREALATIEAFAEAYFTLPVVMQEPVDLSGNTFTERVNPQTKQRQLLSTDLLQFLLRDLPDDAFCRLGITEVDLYPEPSWNFVFGQAYLEKRTGVYSFARYDPAFYGAKPEDGGDMRAILRRFKVLAHETGHMFGMAHCVYLRCLMNGSNHLGETDASPLHLCPVCLRKLRHSLGFDVAERYGKLEKVYRKAGLVAEADWVGQRADFVAGR